jgi:signal transduction histidine kinase
LLDTSRIQVGQLQLVREPCDLAKLVHDVCKRFSDTIKSGGGRLEVLAAEPMIGSWDSSRLDQVLTNLLSNAAKFGRGTRIEVSLERAGSVARIRVRDEGIGIPPEKVTRIFERFERAVSTRSYGGLGLGLFIARGIVEAHGGIIWAESVVGQGTTITIELPIGKVSSEG